MSDVRVIKRKATGFFKKDDLTTIQQAVYDAHNIMTNASILIKAYYLKWFQESNLLDTQTGVLEVDKDMITMACNIVQGDVSRTSRHAENKQSKDSLFEAMVETYNRLYERLDHVVPISSKVSISHVLAYSKTNLITAYENNIHSHFKKYPKKYILCDILSKSAIEPKIAKKIANSVTNMFLYDFAVFEAYERILVDHNFNVQDWRFLFPEKMTVKQLPRCWDLQVHPWVYLYKMVYINQALETDFPMVAPKHKKLLSPLPFHSSFIPMHIRLDTSALSQLLMTKEKIELFRKLYMVEKGIKLKMKTKGDMLSSFEKLHGRKMHDKKEGGEYATSLWKFLTNLESCRQWKLLRGHKKKNDQKQRTWKFDNSVVTDGISISYQVIDQDKFGRKELSGRKKKQHVEEIEEPTLTEEEQKKFKKVSNDPGKKDLLTITDGVKTITYTKGRRHQDTYFKARHTTSRKIRKRHGVEEYESRVMNRYSKNSCHWEVFMRYSCLRQQKAGQMLRCYQHPAFRQFKYLAFTSTKSSEDKFVDKVFKSFKHPNMKVKPCCCPEMIANARKSVSSKKEILIAWGNWGKNPNALRGNCPTPGIGIRRRFESYFKTVTIQEDNTSKRCPGCCERSLDNPGRREGILVHKHHLLRCTNDNCSCRWWNRNVAASFNILCRALNLETLHSEMKLPRSGEKEATFKSLNLEPE